MTTIGTPSNQLAVSATRDFPFYNDQPVHVSGARWLMVMGGVVLGAAADLLVDVPGPGWLGILVRAVLFAAFHSRSTPWRSRASGSRSSTGCAYGTWASCWGSRC